MGAWSTIPVSQHTSRLLFNNSWMILHFLEQIRIKMAKLEGWKVQSFVLTLCALYHQIMILSSSYEESLLMTNEVPIGCQHSKLSQEICCVPGLHYWGPLGPFGRSIWRKICVARFSPFWWFYEGKIMVTFRLAQSVAIWRMEREEMKTDSIYGVCCECRILRK